MAEASLLEPATEPEPEPGSVPPPALVLESGARVHLSTSALEQSLSVAAML